MPQPLSPIYRYAIAQVEDGADQLCKGAWRFRCEDGFMSVFGGPAGSSLGEQGQLIIPDVVFHGCTLTTQVLKDKELHHGSNNMPLLG